MKKSRSIVLQQRNKKKIAWTVWIWRHYGNNYNAKSKQYVKKKNNLYLSVKLLRLLWILVDFNGSQFSDSTSESHHFTNKILEAISMDSRSLFHGFIDDIEDYDHSLHSTRERQQQQQKTHTSVSHSD